MVHLILIFWLVLAKIKCKVHVALLKRYTNQFKPVQQSRQQALRAYCPISIYCGSFHVVNDGCSFPWLSVVKAIIFLMQFTMGCNSFKLGTVLHNYALAYSRNFWLTLKLDSIHIEKTTRENAGKLTSEINLPNCAIALPFPLGPKRPSFSPQ